MLTAELILLVTSPAGAVAKYCDEHVCVSCLSVHEHISGTTRAIFTNFSVWPWLGPPPAGWRNPKEKGQFWGLSWPFKSIGNLRCSRHCCVRCKRDHSIVNNITHQKGSFMLNAWLHVRVINFRIIIIIIIQYTRQVQTGIRKNLSAAGDEAYWPGRGWGVHSTCKVISMTALFFALSVSCSTIATGLTGMLMILHYIQAVHQINMIAYSKRTQPYDSLSQQATSMVGWLEFNVQATSTVVYLVHMST